MKALVLAMFLLSSTSSIAFAQTCTDTAILDFEALKVVDAQQHYWANLSPVFDDDGMELKTKPIDYGPGYSLEPTYFTYFGTQSKYFAGSTMLNAGGEISLSRLNGGLFDLLSIQLAELPAGDCCGGFLNQGPTPVTFTGVKDNGKTVSFTAI